MADLLKGLTLSRKDGTTTAASELKGKVVAFYFSAHWCPPCRAFTPILAKFYDEVNKEGHELEIVFFSFDRSEDQAKSYINEAHGNWLYLLPDAPIVQELSGKFDVSGIPALIILKPDGTVITKDGRSEVGTQPARVVFSAWKNHL